MRGSPLRAIVAARLNEIKRDEAYRAGQVFNWLETRLKNGDAKQRKKAYGQFARKYEGTYYGRLAARLAR